MNACVLSLCIYLQAWMPGEYMLVFVYMYLKMCIRSVYVYMIVCMSFLDMLYSSLCVHMHGGTYWHV